MKEVAWIHTVGDESGPEGDGANLELVRSAGLWPGLAKLLTEEANLFLGPESKLEGRTKDLMGALVAQLNNCEYCQKSYRQALIDRGWSDEKITHILQDINSGHLGAQERALMRFADKLTRHQQAMSAADIEELRRAGFDDRMILEAAAVTAYFNSQTLLANALGVMP